MALAYTRWRRTLYDFSHLCDRFFPELLIKMKTSLQRQLLQPSVHALSLFQLLQLLLLNLCYLSE